MNPRNYKVRTVGKFEGLEECLSDVGSSVEGATSDIITALDNVVSAIGTTNDLIESMKTDCCKVISDKLDTIIEYLKPLYTFTIVPTPDGADVTINGEETRSVTVKEGTEVSYTVSAEGYKTVEGTATVDNEITLDVELVEDIKEFYVALLVGGVPTAFNFFQVSDDEDVDYTDHFELTEVTVGGVTGPGYVCKDDRNDTRTIEGKKLEFTFTYDGGTGTVRDGMGLPSPFSWDDVDDGAVYTYTGGAVKYVASFLIPFCDFCTCNIGYEFTFGSVGYAYFGDYDITKISEFIDSAECTLGIGLKVTEWDYSQIVENLVATEVNSETFALTMYYFTNMSDYGPFRKDDMVTIYADGRIESDCLINN